MYNKYTKRCEQEKKIEQEQKYLTDIIGAAIMMTNPIKIMKYPYCNIFVLSSNLSNYRYNALLALYAIDRPTNQFDIFNHLYKSILTPNRVKKNIWNFLFYFCTADTSKNVAFVLFLCYALTNTSYNQNIIVTKGTTYFLVYSLIYNDVQTFFQLFPAIAC